MLQSRSRVPVAVGTLYTSKVDKSLFLERVASVSCVLFLPKYSCNDRNNVKYSRQSVLRTDDDPDHPADSCEPIISARICGPMDLAILLYIFIHIRIYILILHEYAYSKKFDAD